MSSARGMSGARLRTGWSRSRRTKVEKSLINFQDCHPNWHADGNAGKWLQQLDEYAQEQNNTRLRKQLDDSLFGSLSSSGIRECDTRMRLAASAISVMSGAGGTMDGTQSDEALSASV